MFICTHCGKVSAQTFRRAGNAQAWAIGHINTNGVFTVRRVVWGLLMAQTEKRIDEEIRMAIIMVERSHRKRDKHPQLRHLDPNWDENKSLDETEPW